jgi:hypothetical protein
VSFGSLYIDIHPLGFGILVGFDLGHGSALRPRIITSFPALPDQAWLTMG